MTSTRNQKGKNAQNILDVCGIPIGADFHELNNSQKDELMTQASLARYRKPRSANGSRGRYFHAMLQRRARWYSTSEIRRIAFGDK